MFDFFHKRPYLLYSVIAGFFVLGVYGLIVMPKNLFPDSDRPTVIVMTQVPGATPNVVAATVSKPVEQELSTLALIRNPTDANLGELVWRIGIPLSALILVLLAIPMSFVNPRAGRSVNLAFALLTYVVYSNLLSVSQARVTLGKLEFSPGWWLVHGVMLGLLLILFARRMQLFRLRLAR